MKKSNKNGFMELWDTEIAIKRSLPAYWKCIENNRDKSENIVRSRQVSVSEQILPIFYIKT